MIRFTVFGEAQPAGSKRAFMRPGMKFPVVVDDNPKSKDFKGSVAREAAKAMNGAALLDGPLFLEVTFYRVRPKGHCGKHGVRRSAPSHPDTKPDLLKVTRGVEDAMEGIVYRNDSQICGEALVKLFGEPARVEITVSSIQEARAGHKARVALPFEEALDILEGR
jgi:Holliday junction resolvase RusA-like endonuclease